MKEFNITDQEAGQRINKYLQRILPFATTSFIYKMLRKKSICLNDSKSEGNEILKAGDNIKIYFSDDTFIKFSKASDSVKGKDNEFIKAYKTLKGIRIIHEDMDCIILSKPSGILTQKSTPSDLSLNEYLIGYLITEKGLTENEINNVYKPSVCNRLDRNTSGLVICAKTLMAARCLTSLIKERQIRKFYLTVCEGVISKQIVLDGYLKKDTKNNKVIIETGKSDDFDFIKTIIDPIKNNGKETLLSVEIITGKTHQIRAHLSSIGHALIGDIKYGAKPYKGLKGHLLHSYKLVFPADCGELSSLNSKTFSDKEPDNFIKIESDLFK